MAITTHISTQPTVTSARRHGGWRSWGLVALLAVTAYSTAIGWQAQAVSYRLYREVPPDAFVDYHQRYSAFIPGPVIIPGFLAFLAGIAFWWTRPRWVPRGAAAVISGAGLIALVSTVAWAIPKHNALDREGPSDRTIDSLLQANLVRSLALTAGTITLAWLVGRRLSRAHP